MAKKGSKGKSTRGEQMDLIDVAPENSKEIVCVAKRYKAVQAQRLEALKQEVAEKQNLLDLIKKADLQLVDGKIRCRCDGYIITVTPRDELIKITKGANKEPASDGKS